MIASRLLVFALTVPLVLRQERGNNAASEFGFKSPLPTRYKLLDVLFGKSNRESAVVRPRAASLAGSSQMRMAIPLAEDDHIANAGNALECVLHIHVDVVLMNV